MRRAGAIIRGAGCWGFIHFPPTPPAPLMVAARLKAQLAQAKTPGENVAGSNKDGEVHSLPARNQENVTMEKRTAVDLLPGLQRFSQEIRSEYAASSPLLPSTGGSLHRI